MEHWKETSQEAREGRTMSRDVKTIRRILEKSIEMHVHHMEMLDRLKDYLADLESRVKELEGIKANEKG